MRELEVKRWRRYGKDRLYVNCPTGLVSAGLICRPASGRWKEWSFREAFEHALAAHGRVVGEGLLDLPSTTGTWGPEEPAIPVAQATENTSAPSPRPDQEPFAVTVHVDGQWSPPALRQQRPTRGATGEPPALDGLRVPGRRSRAYRGGGSPPRIHDQGTARRGAGRRTQGFCSSHCHDCPSSPMRPRSIPSMQPLAARTRGSSRPHG